MASTANFGWNTPDNTDLVKDGALAIRTLGNAIDTSLVDLKGGTTGQVLAKNTNTDMDFVWVAQDDSNAIQNAIVDAKGDLISATADNTPARLASSGVNGNVLMVDTSTATGLKWAAPSAGALTLISSTSFSGSSAHNVNDVFSSTYENYFVMFTVDSASASAVHNIRFRVSGADNTTANYYWSGMYNNSGASAYAGDAGAAQTAWGFGYLESGGSDGTTVLYFGSPNRTALTTFISQNTRWGGSTTTKFDTSGAFSQTTSFTGFTIYPSSGTITGRVRVYGFANS